MPWVPSYIFAVAEKSDLNKEFEIFAHMYMTIPTSTMLGAYKSHSCLIKRETLLFCEITSCFMGVNV